MGKPTWDDLLLTDDEMTLGITQMVQNLDGKRQMTITIEFTPILKAQVRKVMDWAEKLQENNPSDK